MHQPGLPSPTGPKLHLSRFVVVLLAAAILLPWLVLLYLAKDLTGSKTETAAPVSTSGENSHVMRAKPGPWGEMQYSRIVIEPPEALIITAQSTARPAVWTFPGYNGETLTAFWGALPLDARQRLQIMDQNNWVILPDGIQVRPGPEFQLGLSPETRAQIYSTLAAFAENPDQNDPFRFRADAAAEWFADSGLKPDTIAQVQRLLYRRGSSLLFSDLNLVLPKIPTLHERTRLIKTLARKSTLMVKLRIRPDSDIDALDRYWGLGQRAKDIKPLLQSVAQEGKGASIDIIHLLPRLPRSLLYTYPTVYDAGNRTYLDCHWSVLNFFNAVPDNRYSDLNEVNRAFSEDYYPFTGKPTFGDVLMFATDDGSVIHSCVYIADDIVYTKNGASPNAPWILMSLSDVIAFYPTTQSLDIQYFRAKAVPVD